jgi:hypothetical protein
MSDLALDRQASAAKPLPVAELERLLREKNPGALLLPPRLLRRVIKEDRHISGIGLPVPHHRTYTIGRERLLQLVERDELGFDADQRLPGTILLIARPQQEALDSQPRGEVLHRFWRLLFHARVHALLERRLAEGRLTKLGIEERIQRLGLATFDEARMVLEQERYLLPPGDETTIYVEFAALYLELRCFRPHLASVFFPSIENQAEVDAILEADVDAAAVLAETRLDGAPGPILPDPEPSPGKVEGEIESRSEKHYRSLLTRAEKEASVGNLVRAMRRRLRAARAASGEQAESARAGATAGLNQLIERLRAALRLDETAASNWRAALAPLLEPASCGIWPVEARLLYDVQKVCLDHERLVYAVDVVEWAYSLGRRPIKRLLPGQAEVRTLKHLRSAAGRTVAARITGAERRRLSGLLNQEIARTEVAVRETFRPWLADVLHEVGMRPGNLPEMVALNKLGEELLDRIVERGYLKMGDLRDAVSRNNLRLPDLRGPGEFFRGDRLIRANRRLPVALDGVYRRGEFYLRWLQRLSSVAFGTAIGRILVLYLLLPFGGAFLALEGVQHILNPIATLFLPEETGGPEQVTPPAVAKGETVAEMQPTAESAAPFEKRKGELFHLATPTATIVLGCILFGLLHSPGFRRLIAQALVLIWRGLRFVLIDGPAFLFNLAAIRWLLASRPIVLFARYLLRPLVLAAAVGLLGFLFGLDVREAWVAGIAGFLAGCAFFNSRFGRELEEAIIDWLVRVWERLSIELVPALFQFIVSLFRTLVETVDRFLYTVDEWLRFRAGQSRWTFVWKLVLGTVWLLISYIIRAYVNLILEPQTNPIKHFPVVTVSAKLLLPLAPTLVGLQTPLLTALIPVPAAHALAWFNVTMLPGIFGFLAWELKENWRLYRANQPATLRPDKIGHHGETVRGLLKPGFHSGTIPKLYKRLRRTERRDTRRRDRAAARKQRTALHHVEEAVRHFTERELLYLLNASQSWGKTPLAAGHVELGCTAIRVELRCPERGADSAWIGFVYHADALSAQVERPGWMQHLEGEPLNALQAALAGWYQLAAVDGAAPIPWSSWVEAWKRDEDGEAPCLAREQR